MAKCREFKRTLHSQLPISAFTHFSRPPLAMTSCTFGGSSPTLWLQVVPSASVTLTLDRLTSHSSFDHSSELSSILYQLESVQAKHFYHLGLHHRHSTSAHLPLVVAVAQLAYQALAAVVAAVEHHQLEEAEEEQEEHQLKAWAVQEVLQEEHRQTTRALVGHLEQAM